MSYSALAVAVLLQARHDATQPLHFSPCHERGNAAESARATRHCAKQFLLGVADYAESHARWCGLAGLNVAAAREAAQRNAITLCT